MTQEPETPLSHSDLIKMLKAELLAERATRTAQPQKEQIGGRQCHLHASRDEITGQFFALTDEDRLAMNQHIAGIVSDLDPQNNRERWLATAIAQDQWRLNRARALENNIFAIGMSGALTAATDADSPQVLAAVCQARVWLADGKHLQALSLYEQRIRRGIEKNEKQLEQLQAPRKAALAQAFEEEVFIAQVALSKGETYEPKNENGFEFSAPEILRMANRKIRLQQALEYQKQTLKPASGPAGTKKPAPFPTTKAA